MCAAQKLDFERNSQVVAPFLGRDELELDFAVLLWSEEKAARTRSLLGRPLRDHAEFETGLSRTASAALWSGIIALLVDPRCGLYR